ncbi:MAG: undecaprenyldiphospho-muramoylpentapeptide beta-N-acetylglucosaminyltransferase [Legionellaceae bacterium]|nr:undecaprenyldiphospho-muramoylpentapeptide beta-N-acetylglucosaminyltransferase [Legionellaceae bacterium]HAF87541.1 undecaprenyldiphospho-muramoylpentapeptide beta-N-acetylglucosaminyltransferase [Legionellales bacterium]HCA89943.1 undecaprenyldiphospho-muramoylpentapeptide beta-N-acetylglucosaminyltransferase [Legionellales bacterium]|tara:strand:+ start:1909 stop:2994 length:1086 start_codon:yes stop_codon:yes gene_type:complete
MAIKIVFTGGGTAGHVTPNIALIEALKQENWSVEYIGSANSIEQYMIGSMAIPFHVISSGKLRRHLSLQNVLTPFLVIKGIWQAYFLLKKLNADVVFSKGGFVSFPVVVAAWLNRLPIMAHESDLTPGLANQMSFPFVDTLCVTFKLAKQSMRYQKKIKVTGTPIRENLFQGSRERGLNICNFRADKPCILVIGGSQGAQSINTAIRQALPQLLNNYQVIHICGKGKLDETCSSQGYKQFAFVEQELAHLFAASDLVISRAGANTLYEILALQKPHILIPLSRESSRGDQIQNASYFAAQDISYVIDDNRLDNTTLCTAIEAVFANKNSIIEKIQTLGIHSATVNIIKLLKQAVASSKKVV